MGFKFYYQCEDCQEEIWCKPEELPDECEACNGTGDARTNKEKYGCKNCEHYVWKYDSCKLEQHWNIEDINCPLNKKI